MNTEDFIAQIPFARDCSVVSWHDCGLVAIGKKAGRASHPNMPRSSGVGSGGGIVPMILAKYNLDKEYYSWFSEDDEKMRLYLINRLDSPTSGIILAATNAEVADAAKAAFAEKKVRKIYYAICVGRGLQKYGKWIDKIRETKGKNFVRGKTDAVGQLAVSKFDIEQLDKNAAGLCLVRLEPETGLTHQLRIQCSQHKMPILGDRTYGNFQANKRFKTFMRANRLYLHCFRTELEIEIGGRKISFEAESPLPQSFATLMEYNPKIMLDSH